MTWTMLAFDATLIAVLIGIAVTTLTRREPTQAVISFITFGLVLALVWARLGAPDVALAEAAIGAGLSGALLLRAASGSRPPQSQVSEDDSR
jgi:energy-converting hydrogenase B subunit D